MSTGGGKVIVGRGAELEALEQALGALAEGAAPVVVISGDPGIGKTRLLEELGARAAERGHLVLAGRASEFESGVPLGIFQDALNEQLRAIDPRTIRALGPDCVEELSILFPALAPLAGAAAPRLQEERARAWAAVRALLARLAARRPLVLLLDDVHWADPASLELVSHLMLRRLGERVMLAFALRAAQAPARLWRALETLTQAPEDIRLDVPPLSRADVDPLLDGIDSEQRARLYDESGGNPFYLRELARNPEASAAARADIGAAPAGSPPPAVAAALSQEIERLSERARTVANAAAVAGDPFDPDAAAAGAELPAHDVLPALDELTMCDVVRATDVPRQFRFRHPLVRHAIYAATPPAWRLGAHERLAAMLGARGEPATALAPHVERSARPGDRAAVALLRAAGEASHALAPAIAARWYGAALRLLPEEATGVERAELLMPLATSLGATGRFEESLRPMEQAFAELPVHASAERVQLASFCAILEHFAGRHDQAHRRVVAALDDVADRRSAEAASLAIQLGVDAIYGSDWPSAESWGLRSLETARAVGDAALVAAAAAIAGAGAAARGRVDLGEPLLAEATIVVDALDDVLLAPRLDALYYLGWGGVCAAQLSDAERHLRRGLALSRQTGAGYLYGPMTGALSCSLALQGRLAEAVAEAQRALDAARLTENRERILFALGPLAWWSAQTGEFGPALRAAEEALALARPVGRNIVAVQAVQWSALTLLEAGRPVACVDLMLELGGPALDRIAPALVPECYEGLVRAELAGGDVEAAQRWAALCDSVVSVSASPLARGHALRGRAAVLLAQGQANDAARVAVDAAALADEVGARLYAARARLLAGRALVGAGDRKHALEELIAAEAAFTVCGAERLRAEAARELRALGRRPPTRRRGLATAGPGELSVRERQVASLVAEGSTNREIAALLCISERTVESHLAHIFEKLGVHTRTALARAFAGQPG